MTQPTDTSTSTHSFEPGNRRDPAGPRGGDRRRGGWRNFRQNYPGFVFTLLVGLAAMLAIDGYLIIKRNEYTEEVGRLQANMSGQERAKAEAIVASEENKTRIALALARRQAKVEKALHLSIAIDSGKVYLERDGAVLREMAVAFGPEAKVGPDSIPVVVPRGEKSVVTASESGITLDGGTLIAPSDAASLAQDTAPIPPGTLRIRRVDLVAIVPNLRPGVRVFFY